MKTVSFVSLLLLTVSSSLAANVPVRVTPNAVPAEIAHAAVRGGDVASGRAVFVDLRCSACHRVQGDDKIHRGDQVPAGPVLNFTGSEPEKIASEIVSRSPLGDGWVAADASGMSTATSRLTIAQLADIVEYLRAVK
jgi:mono/diheme cytochrome c family protein